MKEQLAKILGLTTEVGGDMVREVPVEEISPNPYQPRQQFTEEEMAELAKSIRQYGVLQPVVARPAPQGWELVAGERRLRACKMIGLKTIPVLVKELTDQDLALLSLVENLQRENLSFLEEAQGYYNLLAEFGFTQEELAQKIGKSQSTIANKIRLLKLSPRVRSYISREIITERHARALLKVKGEDEQLSVLKKIVEKGLTVQETEALIKKILAGNGQKKTRRQRFLRIYKDMRIFFNSIQQAVEELQRVGFAAQFEREEKDDHYEITVIIPKKPSEQ